MIDYQKIKEDVSRILSDLGTSVILIKKSNTGSAFNPLFEESEFTLKGVFSTFKINEVGTALNNKRESLLLIRSSDLKLLLESSIELENGDEIQTKSGRYKIIDYKNVSPGEVDLFYICQLRK